MKRIFATLVLATVMTCAFVWVRLQIVSISYELNELNSKERTMRDECNNLTLRINEAKSPRRLELLALNKYKMRPPRPDQHILLTEK